MKTLSLAEIDELDKRVERATSKLYYIEAEDYADLIYLAHAYHAEKVEITGVEDKPHPATLRVILEALRNARNKRATYYSEGGVKENALRASDVEDYLEFTLKKL